MTGHETAGFGDLARVTGLETAEFGGAQGAELSPARFSGSGDLVLHQTADFGGLVGVAGHETADFGGLVKVAGPGGRRGR